MDRKDWIGVGAGLLASVFMGVGAGLAQTGNDNAAGDQATTSDNSGQASGGGPTIYPPFPDSNGQGLSPREAWRQYYQANGRGGRGHYRQAIPAAETYAAGERHRYRVQGNSEQPLYSDNDTGAPETPATGTDATAAPAADQPAAATPAPTVGASFSFDLEKGLINIQCAPADSTEDCARGAVAVINAAMAARNSSR